MFFNYLSQLITSKYFVVCTMNRLGFVLGFLILGSGVAIWAASYYIVNSGYFAGNYPGTWNQAMNAIVFAPSMTLVGGIFIVAVLIWGDRPFFSDAKSMKSCTQCGYFNPSEAKYCMNCGTSFTKQNPQNTVSGV